MQSLEEFLGELAETVPIETTEGFTFSTENLPEPPSELYTDQLIIKKSKHGYSGYTQSEVDSLWAYAHKRTLRLLGLLILTKVFQPQPREVHLRLTHSVSHIQDIVLDYQQPDGWGFASGYKTKPHQFIFWPENVQKHPFIRENIPLWALPLFSLTNQKDVVSEHNWDQRDTIRCAGSDFGNILIAQLLLNLSLPQETCDEVELEGELGYRGVGPGSAEVMIWLPGSAGWSDEL